MTELEILRRRRELVVLSAQLQRATLVRRLDHVNEHPARVVLGLASSVVSIPLLWKLGSMLVRTVQRRRPAPAVRKTRWSLRKLLLSALKFVPMLKAYPVLKFFNR